MSKTYRMETYQVGGMSCINCENKIQRKLKNQRGIANAIVSYTKGTAVVTYDPEEINASEIEKIMNELGYPILNSLVKDSKGDHPANVLQAIGVLVILLAVYLILNRFGLSQIFSSFPQATEGTGYGMLFVIGLLTSVHCIAMCGGINLSQCVIKQVSAADLTVKKFSALAPSFQYNFGRVISYTIIGGIVGALGAVISFSGMGKGLVAVVAGVFMVIMGLNMLNLFPWLRRLNPRMPKVFAEKIQGQKKSGRPFYVGLLNGLMPCGPLQAMQLYALSTGDPIKGALAMFLFSMGTVPLMFGLGALSTLLTKKFAARMMTVSSALVIILGVFMLSNGMALAGYTVPFSYNTGSTSASSDRGATAQIVNGVQEVTTQLTSNGYEPIVVQAGIPVRWTIKAEVENITGCNERMIIPEYNIEKQLVPGNNVIEFTPDKSGIIPYSCWMGMIRSQIAVVDDINRSDQIPVPDSTQGYQRSCCSGMQTRNQD